MDHVEGGSQSATIGQRLGRPLEEIAYSASQRPFTVGNKGKPVMDLFA